MCIIALQPIGSNIPDDYIENMWNNNPDMGGYSFVKEGELITKKFSSLLEFEYAYWADYAKYKYDTPFLLHFRIKTHGAITLENCHPFEVNKNLVFAHNGIIDIKIPTKFKQYSDTWYFNESILKQLPRNFLRNPAVIELVGTYIGNSKLAFLDREGNYTFVNEHLGEWHQGVWYSNNTYEDDVTWWKKYGTTLAEDYTNGYSSYYKVATSTTSMAEEWTSVPPINAKQDNTFWSTLSDSEAWLAGYGSKNAGQYIHMKWVMHQYNMPQVLLCKEQYELVANYARREKEEFSSVYLDHDLLGEALTSDIKGDIEFYSRLTKSDEEKIAAFAESTGLDFDEVYDDRQLIEGILSPDFPAVAASYEDKQQIAS